MLPDAEALDPSADPWPAVFALLDFVQHSMPTTPADWPELVRLLDGVALARHACPTERWCYDDEQHGPLPERSYDEWRRGIGPRFPGFGFYWDVLDPLDPARAENAALGDAIDDLADIAHDLQRAVLVRDRLGEREGRLALGDAFDVHVGDHLRSLQRYLHLRTAGAAWDLDVGGRGTARAADPRPAIDAFLAFVLVPEPLTRAQWAQFARVLDELVMARHAEGTMEPVLELRDAIADLEQVTATLVSVAASSPPGDAHAVSAAFASAFDPLRHGRLRDLQRYVYAVMHG